MLGIIKVTISKLLFFWEYILQHINVLLIILSLQKDKEDPACNQISCNTNQTSNAHEQNYSMN